jgi:hypothetical protein
MASVTDSSYASVGTTQEGGGVEWIDATATNLSKTVNQRTWAYHYFVWGFNIPTSATINGIAVRMVQSTSYSYLATLDSIWLRNSSASLVGLKSISQSMDGTFDTTWGSSTDLWGQSWTPANINYGAFGFAIAATLGHDHSGYANASLVNTPSITVYYTVPAGPALLKTVNGLAVASVKTLRSGLAIASAKTWNGLA